MTWNRRTFSQALDAIPTPVVVVEVVYLLSMWLEFPTYSVVDVTRGHCVLIQNTEEEKAESVGDIGHEQHLNRLKCAARGSTAGGLMPGTHTAAGAS